MILEVRDLVVRVGLRTVIDGLNLELRTGAHVAVLGPNGSGKTSLLNAIAGTEPARVVEGCVRILGEDITQLEADRRASRGLSYVRQRENVFRALTVEENLLLALGPELTRTVLAEGPGGITKAMQRRGILGESASAPHAAHGLTIGASTRAGLLSGGQQQLLAWAMGALRPCKVLLADEPEAGISFNPRLPIGLTTLIVTHQPQLYCEEPHELNSTPPHRSMHCRGHNGS